MSTPVFRIEALTELPFGLPGRVFRGPMPYGDYDPEGRLLKRYREVNVGAVVVLAEEQEMRELTGLDLMQLYRVAGMEVIWLPIPDFSLPSLDALRQAIGRAGDCISSGMNIVVHCRAGLGRTGLFLACLAQHIFRIDGSTAIQWVRAYLPGALETPEQVLLAESYGGRHVDYECKSDHLGS